MQYPGKSSLLALKLFLLFGAASSFAVDSEDAGRSRVGGPCSYQDFPAEAVITGVYPVSDGRLAVEYELRSLKGDSASFMEGPMKLEWRMADGLQPTPEFVKRHAIEAGKHYPSRVRKIIKGTCTPLIVEIEEFEDR